MRAGADDDGISAASNTPRGDPSRVVPSGVGEADAPARTCVRNHRSWTGAAQSWRTVLANELVGIAAVDLVTVPTVIFDQLYALVILWLRQRRLVFATATNRPQSRRVAAFCRSALEFVSFSDIVRYTCLGTRLRVPVGARSGA